MSLRLRALARANDPICEAVAGEELAKGRTALDAVLAGYFAAAGAYAGVLLGPVTLLLGGIGTGDRAFDGRVRQPGKSAKRPRGTLPGEEPPPAARVGVPYSVPALAVAHSYGAQTSLSRLAQPGVALARERGAERRAALLSRVGEVGALAFAEPEFARALVRAFGTPTGGLLTPADFTRPSGLDVPGRHVELGGSPALTAPWSAEDAPAFRRGVSISAVDVGGMFVAAVFEAEPEALNVAELELAAPLLAEPTRRGVPRVTPGTALPAPAPIWISYDAGGGPEIVWTAPSAPVVGAPASRRSGIRRSASLRTVEGLEG